MNSWPRVLLTLLCGCMAAGSATAADATALDAYLADLSTWSASFTQVAVDASGKSMAGGSGKLVIVRPGKFRWESTPDGASDAGQLLIADGRNLWFQDLDLGMVTVKPLGETLQQSPAMLLAGGAELRGAFSLKDDGRRAGFDWVQVQPNDAASDFREALFGFKNKELARLVIVDKLGQRSTLDFKNVKRNVPVDPGVTEFVLPEGVDLVGKPVAP